MKIYWRVCEKQETLSFIPRWRDKDKLEIIKKCWVSLQININKNDEIIVIEDQCSDKLLQYLESKCLANKISFHHVSVKDLDINKGLLTGRSIHFIEASNLLDEHTSYELDNIHFLCNDDFLFLPEALDAMKDIFESGWDGFVLPYDYPDRYREDKTRLCEVYLGKTTHWRTVPSCTSVTSARGRTWQQYMRSFKRNAWFNDDSWTWEAYSFAKSKAICPIPGLATHLTENCMTPYTDWESYWNKLEI